MHPEADVHDPEEAEPTAATESDAVDGDDVEDIDPESTVVMAEDTFSDPDISMEVNVEKLVAELEGAESDEANRKAEIRRRLEELAEEGSFEDTYAVDVTKD